VAGRVGRAARLKREPKAPLGLIDKIFKKACGRRVVVLVAQFVAGAHRLDHAFVVGYQFAQHVARRHIALVVVVDALQLGYLPDRPQRGSADLADALGDFARRGANGSRGNAVH